MSLRWFQKLAEGAPTGLEKAAASGDKPPPELYGALAGAGAVAAGGYLPRTIQRDPSPPAWAQVGHRGPTTSAAPIVDRMRSAAGNPRISYGWGGGSVGGIDAAGVYDPDTHSIWTGNRLSTLMHELGHARRSPLSRFITRKMYTNNPGLLLAPVAAGAGVGTASRIEDRNKRSAALTGMAAASLVPASHAAATLAEETRANSHAMLAGVRSGIGGLPGYLARDLGKTQAYYTGRHLPVMLTPVALAALARREHRKQASAEEGGHWRKLKPGQEGKDQAGTPTTGRTWVAQNRMKPEMTPKAHQKDFAKAFMQHRNVIAAHGTGSGKCVRGDTPVYTNRGVLLIRQLFGPHAEGAEDELLLLPPVLEVQSVVDGQVTFQRIKCLYRQRLSDNESTVVLTVRGGETEVTRAHPLPVVRMGQVEWVPAGELRTGDILAAPKRLLPSQEQVEVPDDLLVLLCWQIAEGHETERGAAFITQEDTDILELLRGHFRSLIPESPSGYIRTPKDRTAYLEINSAAYRSLLAEYGHVWGRKSAEKTLPPWFGMLSDEQLAQALRILFDAEGSASGGGVEFSTASYAIALQVQYALARFGVRAALSRTWKCATNGSRKKRLYYRLFFAGENAAIFEKHIGFWYQHKAEKLREMVQKTRNPNTGYPVGDLLKDLASRGVTARALGLGTRQARYETLAGPAVETVIQNLEVLASAEGQQAYAEKVARLGGTARSWGTRTLEAVRAAPALMIEYARRMRWLVDSGLAFERIESVGVGESGGFVYDMVVDAVLYDHKNYVAGEGVLCFHNTFAAINAFEEAKGQGKATRALVITPAGLRGNFVRKGVQTFTSSKAVTLNRPEAVPEGTDYVVTSYEAFRQNPEKFMELVKPDTIIADEFHRASNPDSQTYKALRRARPQVQNFMGLTASISQNNPAEIVPLLEIATDGKQKLKSKDEFRRTHVKRKPSQQRGIFGGPTYERYLVREALLKNTVGGVIHYVEDLDATEKPAKIVETVPVQMSTEQVDLYRQAMKGIDPKIVSAIQRGEEISDKKILNVFEKLQRARQVSNSLATVTGMSLEDAASRTPKIQKIVDDAKEHLRTTPDGQIVMYTNLVHGGVDVLMAGLQKAGIPYGLFIGRGVPGMTEEKRQQAVEEYLNGDKRVIIITGAGAEGLSLGNTTMVQMVDGHYNPERIAQAEARGVRAGGLSHRPPEERKVQVKRYVSAMPKTFWQTLTFQPPNKSVDEYVYLTAERKARLNKQLRAVLAGRQEHEQKKRESTVYRWFSRGP